MLSCSWERLGHRLWTPICVGLLALLTARWSRICAFSLLVTAEPIRSISSELVTLALGRFGVVLLDDAACLFGWASVWLRIESLSGWASMFIRRRHPSRACLFGGASVWLNIERRACPACEKRNADV